MKNSTSIKIPAKYHVAIREIYKDDDGIWCSLNNGYYAAGMGCYDECHIIHEDSAAELLKQIRLIKSI